MQKFVKTITTTSATRSPFPSARRLSALLGEPPSSAGMLKPPAPIRARHHAAADNALAGYGLRVTKDGEALPADDVSFGGQPGFTWPFQDARQRSQNFKAEFPDVPSAGVWVVQLVDEGGRPAGPAATFELTGDDPNQELYVRYERR